MSTTLIAMSIAAGIVAFLVINLGVLSLLSGAFHFLFARPKFTILRSTLGDRGLAFGHKWNAAREPAKFDKVKLRFFNPFGKPTHVEIEKEYDAQTSDFAVDLDFGPAIRDVLETTNLDDASIQFELISSKDGITHQFHYKMRKFLEMFNQASETAEDFNNTYKYVKEKPVYVTESRSFIADALPEGEVVQIALPTNPAFAAAFAGAGGGGAKEEQQENFAVAKVWIEDGCIVCNACEDIYPEVFEVLEDTCFIRPEAPLNDGLKILDAAEACPVEVIKFDKA